MKLEIKSKSGVAVLIVAILAVVLRIATLGESSDPLLRDAIHAELVSRMGARMNADFAEFERGGELNADGAQTLLERSDRDGIDVHSMKVSQPVLSLSGSEKVVVHVEFSLPQGARQQEYWRFQHSPIIGWRYERETMALSYYLNFM